MSVARPIKPIKRQCNTPEEALGAIITDLRIAKKWSQEDIAEKVGYTKAYMGRVEKGKQSPTLKCIVNVAQVFGLRPSQLLAQAERKQGKL